MQNQKSAVILSIILIIGFLFTCQSSTDTDTVKMEEEVKIPTPKVIETAAFGSEALTFVENEKCKACHPLIYDEFIASPHGNSTIYTDSIHAAVWSKHPKNLKMQQYTCAKCHTPAVDNSADYVMEGKHGMPSADNKSQSQGVSCAACHRIASIEEHTASNTIHFNKEERTYFGTRPNPKESGYHDIILTNKSFNRGDACLACHSHKQNKTGLDICIMDIGVSTQKSGSNCMTCHMPQVDGSVSTERESGTHAFHGFPGTHNNQEMLAKYIQFHFGKNKTGFVINLQNASPHPLLLQPLRLAKLKVKVIRGKKVIKEFKDQVFVRALGKDGKPAFPWKADEIIKNTMIGANEYVSFDFVAPVQRGDQVEVLLGYYLVNPKAAPKLGLEGNKEATEFKILKTSTFTL